MLLDFIGASRFYDQREFCLYRVREVLFEFICSCGAYSGRCYGCLEFVCLFIFGAPQVYKVASSKIHAHKKEHQH